MGCKTQVFAGIPRQAVASQGTGSQTDRSASVGQGDLPQLALGSSWARNPHQPPSLSGAVAEPGHPWGMCQTITFLIEYLINYSGAESIIHISFKRGGKSHCPLTEASQHLPKPWGLSHQRKKLSQQGCGAATPLQPHCPAPACTSTCVCTRPTTLSHTHAQRTG